MTLDHSLFGIAAVIVLLALPGCGNEYGLSPSNPLGTWDVMDVFLTEDKGLERQEIKFSRVDCFSTEVHEKLKDLKVYQYQEFTKTTLGKHVVLIVVDDVHIVRAIGGVFHSRRKSFSEYGGKVESYLASLWAEINGGPAAFEKKNEPGAALNEFLISKIDQGNVHGIWKKMPGSGEISHHQTIQDRILLWTD